MIKTAVFPVAGKGTRFLPITKVIPKEMIPLVNTPIIHYIIKEAIDSGIEKLVFVNAENKKSILNYLKRNYELEKFLEKNNREDLIESIKGFAEKVEVVEVIQDEQLGLGHAVNMSKDHIGKNDFFTVLLGDEVIRSERAAIKQIIDIANKYKAPVLGVVEVPMDDVSKYGVIRGKSVNSETYKILEMIEKPNQTEAPSNLVSPGRYVFNYDIFHYLEKSSKGALGEYQLSDAINAQAKNEDFYAHLIKGQRYDTGNPLGYLNASLDFALKRSDIGDEVFKLLKEKIAKDPRS